MKIFSECFQGVKGELMKCAGSRLIFMDIFTGMAHIQYQRHTGHTTPQALPTGQATHEMAIPNDLIGCIIGRGGQKINEIRYV